MLRQLKYCIILNLTLFPSIDYRELPVLTELQVSLAHRVCLDQQVPVENPEAEELR